MTTDRDGDAGPDAGDAAADVLRDVLVDDVRSFADGRPCTVARSLDEGLALLRGLADPAAAPDGVGRLWLDHDLGVDPRTGLPSDVMPLVVELVAAAGRGERYPVGEIVVHTGSESAAERMVTVLAASGYAVVRSTDRSLWR